MVFSTSLGYPRIGKNREFKRAIESFWKEKNEAVFARALEAIHLEALKPQIEAGLNLIPTGDFSAYDLMLDTALMVGVHPRRFKNLKEWDCYYAMARGTQEIIPCEMKKWFDTNYHYIVPEIEDSFTLKGNRATLLYNWAASKFPGKKFKALLIGPFTFLKLSRIKNNKPFAENLKELSLVYQQIIAELSQTDCPWLQIDEPSLCGDVTKEELKAIERTYEILTEQKGNLKIMLQTYFGDVAPIFSELKRFPVEGVGLDLVRGLKNKEVLKKEGWPKEKWLGLGIVDGRNVWKTNLKKTLSELETLTTGLDHSHLFIHPSSSLLHLPISLEAEDEIPNVLKTRLCFAMERLQEVTTLTKGLKEGFKAIARELEENARVFQDKEFNSFAFDPKVQKRLQNLNSSDFERKTPFEERLKIQQKRWNFPPLPTTTIGSFPQTKEIRTMRAKWKKGEITQKEYEKFIREEIERVVRLQEEIGLDVLVHGEPERTDMVEYFAQQMKGFQFTQNGWVQSYGTRCIRPPIIYGDVSRLGPMTVEEAKVAQGFTNKPMKGMLTGPVTIINWSFPSGDCSKSVSAFQIALALRDEVKDLEAAGIQVIQMDEPALREGLPLKKSEWRHYLKWAVDAFKLTTSGVKDTTQIHTHMCYSEFVDILDSIQNLDADCLSIEDSRSLGRLAKGLAEMHYRNAIGPGVYDVHSERVPPRGELKERIEFLTKHIPLKLLWINPDCGLKTRGYPEAVASLKNMVEAVKEVRKCLS